MRHHVQNAVWFTYLLSLVGVNGIGREQNKICSILWVNVYNFYYTSILLLAIQTSLELKTTNLTRNARFSFLLIFLTNFVIKNSHSLVLVHSSLLHPFFKLNFCSQFSTPFSQTQRNINIQKIKSRHCSM